MKTVALREAKNADQDVTQRPMLIEGRIPKSIKSASLRRNRDQRKSKQCMFVGENEVIQYKATNYGMQSSNSPYYYAVLVVDDKDAVGQVYRAEVFAGRQAVKRLFSVEEQPPRAPMDWREAKTRLGESFGTRKIKRAILSRERNQINFGQLETSAATFISETIDNTLERIQRDGDGMEEESTVQDAILPTYNRHTDKAEQIYGNIVPKQAMAELDVSDKGAAFQNSCGYVAERAKNASSVPILKQLLYLHYLIEFRKLKEPQINSETILYSSLKNAPQVVVETLLSLFAEPIMMPSGRLRYKLPSLFKDRLLAHALVIALTLEKFVLNLAPLCVALQVSPTKILEHAKAVGCIVERNKNGAVYTAHGGRPIAVRFARLTAPLCLPKPKRSSR